MLPKNRLLKLIVPLSMVNLFYRDDKVSLSKSEYATHTYPANNPTEDRFVTGNKLKWEYAGVFDGHGGWQISDFVSNSIINSLFDNIGSIEVEDEISMDAAIIKTFNDLENSIVSKIRPAFQLGFGDVAKVGSCVLIALKNENRLIVANCGDCRAILGTNNKDLSTFFSTRINRDHNIRTSLEQVFLKQNHPNEKNLFICKNPHACYVKGRLQLTRSLGDVYLKYAEFNGSPDRSRFCMH
jgi:pyruvate dehydrogenase phosphatase